MIYSAIVPTPTLKFDISSGSSGVLDIINRSESCGVVIG